MLLAVVCTRPRLTRSAVGLASGISAAAAIGATYTGVGAASGIGAASGVSISTAAVVGTATAVGTATGMGSGAFADTFAQALNANSAGWDNNTLRMRFEAAALSTSGNAVRITIEASSAAGFVIDHMRIGHAAGAGDAYDFASTPTVLTFDGGNAGVTVGTGATKTTDIISFALNEASALIIAVHFNGTSAIRSRQSVADVDSFFKAGADDTGTVNATGYTPNVSGGLRLINRIEVA